MQGAEIYLGDGVYARFDGYQVWVMLQDRTEIALEPPVMDRLIEFAISKGYKNSTIKENQKCQ